ncbi:uncharacterized protein FIBRA_01816 [Fibroporia radiculosa]|uniref:Uncharacterized protein n=1 Tax=Fibroporia radiculosa TaxID=599839 RepID=J4H1F9_9APHY|nr:uncharacterized protein FIBRA_01816 [Fibroporia radiculosa]CCL99794.1 predicted protein [Fibroporia radiculosa]
MSWVAPQQYQQWSSASMGRSNPSQAWSGGWPQAAPAPYPGPPPIPAGVNAQAWTSGQWQYNPMFHGQVSGAQATFQAWAPHPSWGQQAAIAQAQAQAAANYNPYKRIPNPGGPEYWNTKLQDNGLGLENMHIRDDTPKKTQDNGVVHTPWVWVPRELCKSPDRRDSSELHDGQGGSDKQDQRSQTSDPLPESQTRSHERSASTTDAYHPTRTREYNGIYGSSSSHRDSLVGRPAAQDKSDSRRSVVPRPPSIPKADPPPVPSMPVVPKPPSIPKVNPSSVPSMPERNVVPDRVVPTSAPAGMTSFSSYSQQQQLQRQQQTQSQSQHQQQRQQSREVSPRQRTDSQQQARDSRTSPNHPPFSSASSAAAASTSRPPVSSASASAAASEAFSSRQDLHTTFSLSIIRTPGHYSSGSTTSTPTRRMSSDDTPSTPTSRRTSSVDAHLSLSSTPTRRSSTDDAGRTPSRQPVSPHSHGPIYGPPSSNTPSRSNSLSRRQSSAPATSSSATSGSLSAPSLSFLTNFSEEPAGLLSPLVAPSQSDSGSSPGSRAVSRSQTFPTFPGTPFEAIPEDRAVSQPRTPRPPERDRDPNATPYVNPRSPTRSSHTSPDAAPRQISRSSTYPSMGPSSTSPYKSSTSSQSPPAPSRSRASSPARVSRASHNPLPQPPVPTAYPLGTASTASSAAASVPASAPQPQPQPSSPRKIRKGFWNRRGDHLTMERNGQFIVYAPRQLANPQELNDYPSPVDGFMDHRGNKLRYDPHVPELPDSLPLHGEPPRRPYQDVSGSRPSSAVFEAHRGLRQFVQYVYV